MTNHSTKKKNVSFQIHAQEGYEVFVAGSFNNWNPSEYKMTLENSTYTISLKMAPGKHEYKFLINGSWCIDPTCTEWVPDGFGSMNSVIVVE